MKHYLSLLSGLLLTIAISHQTLKAAEEQAMPTVDGTVIFFYYDQLETAAAFYRDTLGLSTTMDAEWVKIFQITDTSSVGLVQQGRGYHEVAEDKPAMLSMVVADVDAWNARLKSAGVTILKDLPPMNATAKADAAPVRGFIAQDPGGYTIEFFTWQTEP